MGNTKQARYNRLGATTHNANNTIHISMTSAPASTSGRTFRSMFAFKQGVSAASQSNVRLNIKTITPELRRRLFITGGKSKEAMKDPPPEFERWIKYLGDVSLNNANILYYDASSNAFNFSYGSTSSSIGKRVITLVEGTPYDANPSLSPVELAERVRTDFCGNSLDSSFVVADQPLAFRLTFNPTTFPSDPDDPQNFKTFHFTGATPNYAVQTKVKIDEGVEFDISSNLNVVSGEIWNQTVDVSLGMHVFNNSDRLADLRKSKKISFIPFITQRSKYTGIYNPDPDLGEPENLRKNRLDISNSLQTGFYVYTPPYLVTDVSLINGSVLDRNGRPNMAHEENGSVNNNKYPTLKDKVIFNAKYKTNGIHMTLNYPFPSDVSSDWIESVKVNFKQPNPSAASDWIDVKNLHIHGTNNDQILFDLCDNAYVTGRYFWLKTTLKVPETCALIDNQKSIFFVMDLSENAVSTFNIDRIDYKSKGNWVNVKA